ncbi:phage terminase small subunit [Paenibacillus sp. WQ 127069]|uniref:Phage terminase small subunit n=1 Tax=Paenibacillus baimaensis TaxID=2982185 RepID=A0ABT2UTS0_9BACL|nr:phage terminase small subunit [Paenibacillus sp. WQ 127069]MCU6798008.1 phage terminase small subunit [Paenibacillus sp. WQ 127069]
MPRPRSAKRKKAMKTWIESGREMLFTELADKFNVSPSQIRKWKFEDNWDEEPDKRPRGAQPGNKNAEGNSGGSGGPEGNDKALKHGAYSKFLPQNPRFQELLQAVQQMDPIDMLWNTVEIAYAKLLWSQDIMFVESKEDHDKLIKGEGDDFVEYEHHRSYNKQATDISAYATISREFRSAVKQFLSMAPENDERRLKLELMQVQIDKGKAEVEAIKKKSTGGGDSDDQLIDEWVEAVTNEKG